MDIRDYLAVLIRRKWIILVTTVTTVIVAILVSYMMTPVYAATATVRVATGVWGRVDYADYVYSERLMNTYAEIITAQPVLEDVMQRLEISTLPQIEVEVVPDTELLRITAEGHDPERVKDVANALAEALQTQSEEIYGSGPTARETLGELLAQVEGELAQARSQRDTLWAQSPDQIDAIETLSRTIELKEQTIALLLTQYEDMWLSEAMRATTISIVEPATRPWAPSKPRIKINALLGAVVGLAAGIGLAVLVENLDSTFHTTKDITSEVESSILGKIPEDKGFRKAASQLAFSGNGFSVQCEAYRRLRTNILAFTSEHQLKTLVTTSADRAEGKSTVVANLALAFAETNRRVVLVDADLRLPSQHRIFDLPNDAGLSNALLQENSLEELVQPTKFAGLYVLASGPPPGNPAELLGSEPMQDVIDSLAQEFDIVLIDTPCLLSVTDAAVLSPLADGVVVVVSRGKTKRESLQSALGQLADVKANAIGVVVNRSESDRKYYGKDAYIRKRAE
jgi:succinoglycan biosynthesis transport protein ExoP